MCSRISSVQFLQMPEKTVKKVTITRIIILRSLIIVYLKKIQNKLLSYCYKILKQMKTITWFPNTAVDALHRAVAPHRSLPRDFLSRNLVTPDYRLSLFISYVSSSVIDSLFTFYPFSTYTKYKPWQSNGRRRRRRRCDTIN